MYRVYNVPGGFRNKSIDRNFYSKLSLTEKVTFVSEPKENRSHLTRQVLLAPILLNTEMEGLNKIENSIENFDTYVGTYVKNNYIRHFFSMQTLKLHVEMKKMSSPNCC